MGDGRISIGLVVGLEYHDPLFDPHAAFQHFKRHPFIRGILEGGQIVRYGAKAVPEGGWNTQPQLFLDGALIVGDAGKLRELDASEGHSSRDAKRHARRRDRLRCRAREATRRRRCCTSYKTRVDASAIKTELYPMRNVHQAFGHGLIAGSAYAGIAMFTNGRLLPDLRGHPGHREMRMIEELLRAREARHPGAVERRADRSQADVRQGHRRALLGHASRRRSAGASAWCIPRSATRSAAASTGIRACSSVRPTSTRWSTTARAGCGCRSTRRTACTARPATSWIPYGVITWVAPEGGEGPSYDGM